jgi:hypothetical protein
VTGAKRRMRVALRYLKEVHDISKPVTGKSFALKDRVLISHGQRRVVGSNSPAFLWLLPLDLSKRRAPRPLRARPLLRMSLMTPSVRLSFSYCRFFDCRAEPGASTQPRDPAQPPRKPSTTTSIGHRDWAHVGGKMKAVVIKRMPEFSYPAQWL